MEHWIKYVCDVKIKEKIAKVIAETWYTKPETSRPHKRRGISRQLVKTWNISHIAIPFTYVDKEVEIFDSTAFQMDDRFFTSTKRIKVYDPQVLAKIKRNALKGYNTEPIKFEKHEYKEK